MLVGGWKRLGCLTGGAGFPGFLGCRFSEAEPRGGVPGSVKWMVLGRKLWQKFLVSNCPLQAHHNVTAGLEIA